jgi:tetratricopeptide (TPR) repeat protein
MAVHIARTTHPSAPKLGCLWLVVLYNLGMALSDLGHLPRAVSILRQLATLEPTNGNARVALGVALARSGQTDEAVAELTSAAKLAPTNPWVFRNLGGTLVRQGRFAEALPHFRRAVELAPSDAAARAGLGRCLIESGQPDQADEHLLKAIDLDPTGPAGESAKADRSRIAHDRFRSAAPSSERPDAVMYCLGAMEKFGAMTPAEVQAVGFEIAILGTKGLNPNDPSRKYTLKSMPGSFTALHLLCLLYVAFQQIAPDRDTGFDLSREYAAAKKLMGQGGAGPP